MGESLELRGKENVENESAREIFSHVLAAAYVLDDAWMM
jgi:hypothetical protein